MDSPPVPEELLVDIFLRIPDPADLVRASAACVSFRRLVADRSFLRKFRKLHAPPFLGFLFGRKEFHPAIAPHPSAPAASAVAVAADFSFSFLPAPTSDWIVQDIRDGRVLLGKSYFNKSTVNFKEIVVCDPLHRQYLLLPPIPDELFREVLLARQTFLVPWAGSGDKEETAEETSYRVIWMARRRAKLVALVFSSTTGQWQAGPSHSWSNSFQGLLEVPGMVNLSRPQYAYGCFYWVTDSMENLLVLDTRRMEFSVARAPPDAKDSAHVVDIAFVEAGEGRAGVFMRPKYTKDLNYSIRQNNCGSSSQWQFERTVSLDFEFSIIGSAGRHLFLFQWRSPSLDAGCVSLDVETFQLERVFVSNSCVPYGRTYSNFPPSLLSTPTISSDSQSVKEHMPDTMDHVIRDRGQVEKEVLEQGCGASSTAESPCPSD